MLHSPLSADCFPVRRCIQTVFSKIKFVRSGVVRAGGLLFPILKFCNWIKLCAWNFRALLTIACFTNHY
jgi:hypothetical protein